MREGNPEWDWAQSCWQLTMLEKRQKQERHVLWVSELTIFCSLDAKSLNCLLSVFSSFWSYVTPPNFMCPLKTCDDGRSCLLRVASEESFLTWRREADESVWSKKCCKIAAFDERGDFLNRPWSSFFKVVQCENSLARRAIRTGAWIKRLFVRTSEVFLSDVC